LQYRLSRYQTWEPSAGTWPASRGDFKIMDTIDFKKVRALNIAEEIGYPLYIKTLKKLLGSGLVSLEMPREIIDLKVIEAAFYIKCLEKD